MRVGPACRAGLLIGVVGCTRQALRGHALVRRWRHSGAPVSAEWYETVLEFERSSTAALEIVLAHPSGRFLSVNRGLRAPVAECFVSSRFHGCVVLTCDIVTASE